MAILNAAYYLNHSRVFGWQILKSVVPTDTYSTIFHNAVLPSVVDDVVIIIIITACPHQKVIHSWPETYNFIGVALVNVTKSSECQCESQKRERCQNRLGTHFSEVNLCLASVLHWARSFMVVWVSPVVQSGSRSNPVTIPSWSTIYVVSTLTSVSGYGQVLNV